MANSWTNPMLGNVDGAGQKYGDPRDGGRTHVGYDIGTGGVAGRPVVSAARGVVLEADESTATARGKLVMIDHGDGVRTLYQHLASTSVVAGQSVSQAQQIGICGGTGGSYAIHLHLEVYPRGSGTSKNDTDTTDPKQFFLDRDVVLGKTPPAPEPPTDPEDDMTQLMLVREAGTPGVYITDLISRRHVINNSHLEILQRRLDRWGIDSAIVDVADLRAYGPVIPFA